MSVQVLLDEHDAEILLPSISVVIEWENVKLSEQDRAFAMLRTLSDQVGALQSRFSESPELIVMYDKAGIDRREIEAALEREIAPASGLTIRLEAVEGLEYYGQKNRGASIASRELVVFLDSDVIPEPDWLIGLLEAAIANKGSVICGSTYLDPETFIGRCFAVFWFFPVRQEATEVVPVAGFLANNLLIAKSLFPQYEFPGLDTMRGQCQGLANKLSQGGVPMLKAQGARACHPAPNGFTHFIRRSLSEGHDAYMLDAELASRTKARFPVLRSLKRMARHYYRSAKRVLTRYRAVKMPIYEVPFAFMVALVYYTLYALGEVIASVNKSVIPERFGI